MTTAELVGLALIVWLAFSVEAALGFGATVVTVAIGSLLAPIELILPAFVPLNVVLSTYLVTRHRKHIDWRLLLVRVLPPVAVGMPLGIFAFARLDERMLKIALGVFVVLLALLELVGSRRSAGAARTLPRPVGLGMLAIGGAAHGAFGTGGPMVVYVFGRELGGDKGRFRATLSVLWLVLNAVLVTTYAVGGHIGSASLTASAAFVVPLLVGLVAGEWAHARIPAERFRGAVFALLGVVGTVLALKNIL